jgi:hypothetical protein
MAKLNMQTETFCMWYLTFWLCRRRYHQILARLQVVVSVIASPHESPFAEGPVQRKPVSIYLSLCLKISAQRNANKVKASFCDRPCLDDHIVRWPAIISGQLRGEVTWQLQRVGKIALTIGLLTCQ